MIVTFTPEAQQEPLVGEELLALFKDIDGLPLDGTPDPDLSATYREILYPSRLV